jgi:hypothetical protein
MKIVDDGSGYGSHLEILELVLMLCNPKRVLEFGMGKFSTPLLLDKDREVVSVEMQDKRWYEEMLKFCTNNDITKNWFPMNCVTVDGNSDAINFFLVKVKIDFAFVDGHGLTRPECVNKCIEAGVPVIMAHDTETNWYRWDRIKMVPPYRRFKYSVKRPNTDIFTTSKELISDITFLSKVQEVEV